MIATQVDAIIEAHDGTDWVQIPFESFSVREQSRDPVRELNFEVAGLSRDSVPWGLLTLGRSIRLTKTVDGEVYSFKGTLVTRPLQVEGPQTDRFSLTCYDESYDAQNLRFADTYPREGAMTWTEIVEDAWTRYGPDGISFAGVQDLNETASPISSNLETLFDFMEEVAGRTGWRWYLEDHVLFFQDPATKVSELVLDEDKIRPGLSTESTLADIVNSVFVPARFRITDFEDIQDTTAGQHRYFTQYAPLAREFESAQGTVQLDDPPEVYLNGVELSPVVPEDDFDADEAPAVFNAENRFIRLRDDPAGTYELKVIYTAEISVIVRRDHLTSIDLFGRREHVIRKSPRPSRSEAEAIADAFLEKNALPTSALKADLLVHQVRAGWYYRIKIPAYGIDQLMPAVVVDRSWSPNQGLRVTADFTRAPLEDDDLIVELFRRINKMESGMTARAERVERYADFDDFWLWDEQIDRYWSVLPFLGDSHTLTPQVRHFYSDTGRQVYPG